MFFIDSNIYDAILIDDCTEYMCPSSFTIDNIVEIGETLKQKGSESIFINN